MFVISGIAYSGAEIVLDTFIKANNQIIPFFYIILNNSQVEKTYLNNYEKKNVFFGHLINQRILNWFAPMILKNKIENDISKIRKIKKVSTFSHSDMKLLYDQQIKIDLKE